MQGVLAGLPLGIPGMGVEIEGAVQQAPQASRHFIIYSPGVESATIAGTRCEGYSLLKPNFILPFPAEYLPERVSQSKLSREIFTAQLSRVQNAKSQRNKKRDGGKP